MSKKIIFEISLIKESKNKTNQAIIREILSAFSDGDLVIPWCNKVEKITILE